MNTSFLDANIHIHTAITALKNAYDECSERVVKESIVTACKAIMELHNDLGEYIDPEVVSESDSGYDSSEYCAAV